MFKPELSKLLQVCAVAATVAGASATARAEDVDTDYGNDADAHHCEPEFDAFEKAPDNWKWLDEALASGKVFSATCKAEFDKRMALCLKDPKMEGSLKNPDIQKGVPGRACHQRVFGDMANQIMWDREQAKRAAEEAKAKADEEAKYAAEVAARELPKGTRHDAKLEKLVAAAYAKDYPDGKVLKIILGDWSDDYEKDDFGRVTGRDLDAFVVNKQPDGKCFVHDEYWLQHGNGRSFGGPLSARGAGSASDAEILCSKAEGGAAARKPAAAKVAPKKK